MERGYIVQTGTSERVRGIVIFLEEKKGSQKYSTTFACPGILWHYLREISFPFINALLYLPSVI
jgi:hypothetical protein